MRTLVILSHETAGFNSTLRLARRLARQHRVIYVGPERFAEYVRRQGFEYAVVDVWGAAHLEARYRELGELAEQDRDVHRADVSLHYGVRAVDRWLDAEWPGGGGPDLALVDILIWGRTIPFVERGVPVVNLCAGMTTTRDLARPPTFSGVRPDPRTGHFCADEIREAWRLVDEEHWAWRARCRAVRRRVAAAGIRVFPSPRRRLRLAGGTLERCEYGPKLAAPELVLSPREFEFPHGYDGLERCHAGTCVDLERCDAPFAMDWLDVGRSLAYGSLGTYSASYPHAERLFRAAVEVFGQRPDWQLVLQTGTAVSAEQLAPLPPNVRVEERVPQLELLRRASLAIGHAGITSVREAILFGVPMIVFPQRYDQPGCAARIDHHRVGLVGDSATVDARQLGELVDRIADDPAIHSAVRRMQAVFRRQEDCEPGFRFIDGLLGGAHARDLLE